MLRNLKIGIFYLDLERMISNYTVIPGQI